MKKLLLIASLTLSLTTILFAKSIITIGSGKKGGNYYTIAEDIVDFCNNEVKQKTGYNLININTKGPVANIFGLLKEKYSIGFVREDIYTFFKEKDQMGFIGTYIKPFMNLYPEYLHILIPRGWKYKSGKFFSKFSESFNFKRPISIMILKNQVVYAKDDAIVSAQALSNFMGLNLHVVDASNVKKIDAPFIFVTGNGNKIIQKMLNSGKWFLLNFNSNELANKTSIYKPAVLTYIVNGKKISVNTISILSKIYEKSYRYKKRKKVLKILKQCIENRINNLIDSGNSNKWSIIIKINGWAEKKY